MKKFIGLALSTLLLINIFSPLTIVHAEETILPSPTMAEPQLTEIPQATDSPQIALGPPALIIIYRISNVCFIYDENSQLLNSFPISTGKPGHETPLGIYKIYQHTTGEGYHLMVDGTYGRYCMRFKQGGYMFHSVCYPYPGAPDPISQEIADIGTSVSRGCIRLKVSDAAWLYNATPDGCLVAILDC